MAAGVLVAEHGAQGEGDLARRDLHGALGHAAAACRAVLYLATQLAEYLLVDAPVVDLRVVDGLDEHAVGHVLVARMELQGALGAGHGADGLALAATRAGLHGSQDADELVLVGKARLGNVLDETVEGEGVGSHGKVVGDELGRIHDFARIHMLLKLLELVHALLAEEVDLGDADAVLAGDDATHLLALGHNALDDFLAVAEHVGIVGVDRDVDVAVAVAGVHVAGHD